MAENPWHARLAPIVLYVLFLPLEDWITGWALWGYPLVYTMQCAIVAYLLWRYRKLLPELRWRFHWLAVPTAVGLCAAWIWLGNAMIHLWPSWCTPDPGLHDLQRMQQASTPLFYSTIALRLLGMTLIVPMVEELYVRSAALRGLHSAKRSAVGLVQLACDFPLVGEWLMETRLGRRATASPAAFTWQLEHCPLGKLTAFGVFASTLLFMFDHQPRDWAGAVLCGLVWCALLWWTNRGERKRPDLGPVMWSHGLTNALLLAWCLYNGHQWYFL